MARYCDVCLLLDGRETVAALYCGTCQAWLCNACRTNWLRRARAFFAARKTYPGQDRDTQP